MVENGGMTPADMAAVMGNNNNGGLFGNDNGAWWIIILFLFAFAGGWGNNNGGAFGGGGMGVSDGYVLASDFATLQRQIESATQSLERKGDTIVNGLCDGFFNNAQQINGVNTNILTQGNATNMAMMQGFNATQAQMAQCCCDMRYDALKNSCDTNRAIETGFAQTNYNLATQANGMSREMERGFCNTNFAMQSQHCQTMQAIDKVGDRVIDWLSQRENQQLRDENAALRLAASQANQNNVIIGALKQPCPIPAYQVPNPYCNCNNGCGC